MEAPVGPQRPQDKALFDAIRARDLAAVQRALKAGASPNASEVLLTLPSVLENDPGGRRYYADTALLIAVAKGSEPIVRLLLERGAEINSRSHDKVTPLMAAVIYEEVGIIRLLLSRGALVNLTDNNGDAPLDRIIDTFYDSPEKPEIVSLLLRAGGKRLAKPESWHGQKAQEKYDVEEKRIQKMIRSWPQKDLTIISEDHALMKLFLPDLSEVIAKDTSFREARGRLVDFIIDSKIHNHDGRYGWTQEQERQVTLELRQSLLVRNQKSITWESLDLPENFRFVVGNPEPNSYRAFPPIDTGLWIKASLPGYTRKYHMAVINFVVGLTYHRETGFYLLEKRANQWRVVWRNFR